MERAAIRDAEHPQAFPRWSGELLRLQPAATSVQGLQHHACSTYMSTDLLQPGLFGVRAWAEIWGKATSQRFLENQHVKLMLTVPCFFIKQQSKRKAEDQILFVLVNPIISQWVMNWPMENHGAMPHNYGHPHRHRWRWKWKRNWNLGHSKVSNQLIFSLDLIQCLCLLMKTAHLQVPLLSTMQLCQSTTVQASRRGACFLLIELGVETPRNLQAS